MKSYNCLFSHDRALSLSQLNVKDLEGDRMPKYGTASSCVYYETYLPQS